MKVTALLILAALSSYAQPDRVDLYPTVRTLLHEAEAAAANIAFFEDRSNPHSWASRLYARAGYLDDAIRAYGAKDGAYSIWQARVVYGDLAGAEKDIQAMSDPESKATRLVALADLLWRMGQPEPARIRFEAARQLAPKVLNLERRKRLMAAVESGLTYLPNEPPARISAQPSPPARAPVRESPLPLFPITQDGFRDRSRGAIEERGKADAELMTKLYGRVTAGDREGLVRVVDALKDPFQKALGLASIEHLLLQARLPDAAEQYAQQIPTVDSDCKLAKAEALSAAGAAWLLADNASRARKDFEAATDLVRSVPDLPLGKVIVVLSIATAQGKSGMAAPAAESLKFAKELSLALPLRPPATSAPVSKPAAPLHYRDEAYEKILLAAVGIHDLGVAQEAANLWRQADSRANVDIVRAWLDADRVDDAIAYARGIANLSQRAEALLILARELLDRAGAPNI